MEQSRMDNPGKQGTLGAQETRRKQGNKNGTESNICRTPLYPNKHK